MAKLHTLAQIGQSIWFDYIRRSLINSGELKSLIDQGIRGVTSNPTIFEKAIAGSSDYDDDLAALAREGLSIEEIYERLALDDIARTADLFRKVYDETGGLDGYVSIEVSPELAYDTEKTIQEARRLFSTLNRPNIMIKVPATREGVPAIETLIAEGINVNVTLLFSVQCYEEVAYAYLNGLERLKATGKDISRVASVASFFVSRVDTSLDPELEKRSFSDLIGKIAVANAKVAYGLFREIFSGPRWQALQQQGARPQRLLWASTGTKNPKYPDTLYVDELIGPHTVNTLPPATLQAYLDHGKMEKTLDAGFDEARDQIARLTEAGIDLDAVTTKLQNDGVDLFAGSFRSLMDSIAAKRRAIISRWHQMTITSGDLKAKVDARLQEMDKSGVMSRIYARDYTVWSRSPKEITNRLAWLFLPSDILDSADGMEQFARDIVSKGYTRALLLGMGGSSLAPEVMRAVFGVREGYLDLVVIDSTDPDFLAAESRKIDPAKTLFIVSTKSGTTVETLSFFKYFYTTTADALGAENAGEHFIAITDPGSPLVETARTYGFRNIFLNEPDLGGRYSALSHFGLVPAALIGADIKSLLDRALVMTENCQAGGCTPEGANSGGTLGALLGEAALAGRNKVTFFLSPAIASFGDWVEQLIAESTGKEGKGIVPIVRENPGSPGHYRSDRLFVSLRLEGDDTHEALLGELEKAGHPVVRIVLHDRYDIGGQFYLWEMATSLAGYILGINPFDQPDVEAAKKRASEAMERFRATGALPAPAPALQDGYISVYGDVQAGTLSDALASFLAEARSASYVAIQAYLPPAGEIGKALDSLCTKIRDTFRIAVMSGYGPRYLHSTGQLHKGDEGRGLFIQITRSVFDDLAIPDEPGSRQSTISFGTLKSAQALGDWNALKEKGRKVLRLHILDKNIQAALKRIAESL